MPPSFTESGVRNGIITLWRPSSLPAFELAHMMDLRTIQPRQYIPTLRLVLIETGVRRLYYQGAYCMAPAGSLLVLRPGDVQGSEPVDELTATVRVLSADPVVLAEAIALPDHPDIRGSGLLADPETAIRFRRLHNLLARPWSCLEQQSALIEFASHFYERCAALPIPPDRPEPGPLARVRQLLEDRYADDLSLADLAEVACMDPAYLCRAFRRRMGLPPHAFQTSVRTARARLLLAAGLPPGEVAVETGFFDQAHFTHTFRRHFNISPAQYSRCMHR